jgi:hypothetical protein
MTEISYITSRQEEVRHNTLLLHSETPFNFNFQNPKKIVYAAPLPNDLLELLVSEIHFKKYLQQLQESSRPNLMTLKFSAGNNVCIFFFDPNVHLVRFFEYTKIPITFEPRTRKKASVVLTMDHLGKKSGTLRRNSFLSGNSILHFTKT